MATTTTKTDLHDAAERARRIEQEAGAAVEVARKKHQQAGVPMAGWRDGRVVVVDPVTLEELPQTDSKESS
ncbi:MAG: hypothetical protein IT428_13970 [Planctomycetaceae bacterium]|nr:hypothetical protein [Planctomycetaceae bacterium]